MSSSGFCVDRIFGWTLRNESDQAQSIAADSVKTIAFKKMQRMLDCGSIYFIYIAGTTVTATFFAFTGCASHGAISVSLVIHWDCSHLAWQLLAHSSKM